MARELLPVFLHLSENLMVSGVSAIFTGRLWPGLHARFRFLRVLQGVSGLEAREQRRPLNIAETAIGLRVQAGDALYLVQGRQRRSSSKVIQLDDCKT